MITASVNFFENNIKADLTCREREIQDNLNKVGVITPISQIPLNNALTLQVHLYPNDEIGKMVYDIVDFDKDTLGNVQRLLEMWIQHFQYTMGKSPQKEQGGYEHEGDRVVCSVDLEERMGLFHE